MQQIEVLKYSNNMALNTRQLNKILKGNPYTRNVYLGTYPACRVQKIPKGRTISFITNTAHHSQGYGHWNGWVVKHDVIYIF